MGNNNNPLDGKLPVADKQPTLSKNTSKLPKLPQQQCSHNSVERQMRAFIVSDDDLDHYNLHNPLAEVMDISDKDWD